MATATAGVAPPTGLVPAGVLASAAGGLEVLALTLPAPATVVPICRTHIRGHPEQPWRPSRSASADAQSGRSTLRRYGRSGGSTPTSRGGSRATGGPAAEWVNNTVCLDTGAVFGGSLTALRYPERELVSVPAERQWYEPSRPLAPVVGDREPSALAIEDVAGTRWLETSHAGKVKIAEENAAAALEVMSRFAVDPRWLIYLPPTMSPAAASHLDGFLEHPEEAFEEYAGWGVSRVVCEEKHMGSRAIAVLARDQTVAERRFGVNDGTTGVVYTRTGRPFFTDTSALVDRLTVAVAPLFERLESDWLAVGFLGARTEPHLHRAVATVIQTVAG